MTLPRFGPDELRRFLEALDAFVDEPTALIVIGGSALSLGYGVTVATNDIDTYASEVDGLQSAAARARQQTGLPISLSNSVIAQLPCGYRERLHRALPHLSKLHIFVLDPYDLACSKLLRGTDHDRQQLRRLHDVLPFDVATLVARFRELLDDHVGDTTEPRWSLSFFVEEVWGELAALELRPPRR